MISLTCKAAIKSVIFLGMKTNDTERISIKEIAANINENEHTVGKLLQKLVQHKIIHSAKGPNGGFYITDLQQKLAVIRVVEAIDGEEVFKKCGLGFSKCSAIHPCPLHKDFEPVRALFKNMCDSKSISDLQKNVENGLAFLVG
jgi:Rrf2 family protein